MSQCWFLARNFKCFMINEILKIKIARFARIVVKMRLFERFSNTVPIISLRVFWGALSLITAKEFVLVHYARYLLSLDFRNRSRRNQSLLGHFMTKWQFILLKNTNFHMSLWHLFGQFLLCFQSVWKIPKKCLILFQTMCNVVFL